MVKDGRAERVVAVSGFWDRFLTRRVERVHVNGLVKNGTGERGKKVDRFQRGGRLRFSSSYVKGFVKLRAVEVAKRWLGCGIG